LKPGCRESAISIPEVLSNSSPNTLLVKPTASAPGGTFCGTSPGGTFCGTSPSTTKVALRVLLLSFDSRIEFVGSTIVTTVWLPAEVGAHTSSA
jgi:hypothetical protein